MGRPQCPGNETINFVNYSLIQGPSDLSKTAARKTPVAYCMTSDTTRLPEVAWLSDYSLILQRQSFHRQVPHLIARLNCLPHFHVSRPQLAVIFLVGR